MLGISETFVARGRARPPPIRLPRSILLVLSFIRSGSSLLQLCLNAHPELYAGQELYLLVFDTMGERLEALGGTDYEEGLLATVMELQRCSLVEAEGFLDTQGHECPTWQMYQVLQELCGLCLLVDKTPFNASHPMILRHASEVFASPYYLHLVRHPYAAIDSGLQLTRDILGGLGVTWASIEQSWANTVMGTYEYLLTVPPAAKLSIRWVDFLAFRCPYRHTPAVRH